MPQRLLICVGVMSPGGSCIMINHSEDKYVLPSSLNFIRAPCVYVYELKWVGGLRFAKRKSEFCKFGHRTCNTGCLVIWVWVSLDVESHTRQF